jgi:hypothetical protein
MLSKRKLLMELQYKNQNKVWMKQSKKRSKN